MHIVRARKRKKLCERETASDDEREIDACRGWEGVWNEETFLHMSGCKCLSNVSVWKRRGGYRNSCVYTCVSCVRESKNTCVCEVCVCERARDAEREKDACGAWVRLSNLSVWKRGGDYRGIRATAEGKAEAS